MDYFRNGVGEALKLALGVFTFVALSDSEIFTGLKKGVLGELLYAVAAGVIYVLVTEVLLGHARLAARWTVNRESIVDSWASLPRSTGEPESARQLIRLQYFLEGRGLWRWIAQSLIDKGGYACELRLAPRDVASTTIEKGAREGHNTNDDCQDGGVLVSHFIGGIGATGSHACIFQLVCFEASDQREKLACEVVLHAPKFQSLVRRIIKCDATIKGFELVGSN